MSVSLLNPSLVVLGGELAQRQGYLLAAVRETVYRRSLPLATRNLQIVNSVLGQDAGLLGAAHLVSDAIFLPRLCGCGGGTTSGCAGVVSLSTMFRNSLGELRSMSKAESSSTAPASELIDQRIAELGDWRGATLARMRALIREADPEVVETWKWMGTPVFEHAGIICTGESYKQWIKLTFAKGAALPDPHRLFNASLDGNARRAIDIREGEAVDAEAFKALIRAAIEHNLAGKAKPKQAKA